MRSPWFPNGHYSSGRMVIVFSCIGSSRGSRLGGTNGDVFMLPSRSIQDIPLLIGNKHAKWRPKTFKRPLVLGLDCFHFFSFPTLSPFTFGLSAFLKTFPMLEANAYQFISLPISLHCYSQIHEIIYYSCLCLYGAEPLLICIAADF